MFNPYFLMTVLYLSLAMLGALDAALIHFDFLPAFAGLRWVRVHFITLGALTEFAFGVLPLLVAAHRGVSRPKVRWDIWLTFNLGLLVLFFGIPLVNAALITTGGTLISIAALLLMQQLLGMGGNTSSIKTPSAGRKFYVMGLAYLLLGILIGTGLWQGWLAWFRIQVPIEVHIHANNWGFMSLVFAGLLVDLYPSMTGRSLTSSRNVNLIFWGMSVGALGLVLGPWVKSNWFSVPGLILHLSATIWVVVSMIQSVQQDARLRTVGMFHLITAYVWILAPVLVAPLIILQVPGFPGAGIEQNAPQALIYGWVLQFGYALIPLLFRRVFLSDAPNELGGHWLSLIAVHVGGVLLWAGIFLHDSQSLLHGMAYSLWFISMLPIVWELWQITHTGLDALMPTDAVTADVLAIPQE